MKKKQGYTLVELMVVMFILSVLFGMSGIMVKSMLGLKSDIKLESTVYEIKELLSYGKLYSKKNKTICTVLLDGGKNTVTLIGNKSSGIQLREVKIPRGIKIVNNFGDKLQQVGKIIIKDTGYIATAGTIEIKDNKNNKYRISIAVGNDLITIY